MLTQKISASWSRPRVTRCPPTPTPLGIMSETRPPMVLYQLGVQLEKLAKEAQPVSLRERGRSVRCRTCPEA